MKYIAILGRQPELGLVELESLFGPERIKPWGKMAALLEDEPDINRLGGTQKIGRVIYQGPARDINEAPISVDELPRRDGKTTFGLSYYGLDATQRFVVANGITMKKRLRGKGSVRYVAPQNGLALGAAQVKFNGLITGGFELLIAINKQQMVVAITTQIQDIDWYAARDYARPSRSAKVGMLPPKLAQIMINTTSAPLVYDPFCGTGVVLQEALLLDRAAAGSDLSEEMVQASRNNLEWLQQKRSELKNWSVESGDASTIKLPDTPLAIVSEGYLGPNQSKKIAMTDLKKFQPELLDLYKQSLKNWTSQVEAGTEVTITAPVWLTDKGWQPLPVIDHLTDLGYTLKQFAHQKSDALVYRRPDQYVGRQLLILRKS